MNDEYKFFKENKVSFKDEILNFMNKFKRLNFSTIIFTKNKYKELEKTIEEIQVKDIKDYKTFEYVGKFQKQSEIGYKILEIFTIFQIIKMFSKFKFNSEYDYKKVRIYPILRIFCAWKIFYLYMVYKFNLEN